MDGTALIVEDHPLYRDALHRLICGLFGEACTFAVASAEEGLVLASTLSDLRVVFLDMGLPGLRGTEAVMAFRRACPQAQLIAVSGSNDRREVTSALKFGVKAFVSKTVLPDALVAVVQKVVRGDTVDSWVTSSASGCQSKGLPALTSRQIEILQLLGEGHGNKEIGLRLGISEIRVKQHISALFRIFNASNRMQVVLVAQRMGMSTSLSVQGEDRALATV